MNDAMRLIGMAYRGIGAVLVIVWIAFMMSAREDHRAAMAQVESDKPRPTQTFVEERPTYRSLYSDEDPYSRAMDDTRGESTAPTAGDWGY